MYFRKRSLRFILLFIFFILFFGFFTLKLILIQVFRSSYLNHLAQKQQTHVITLAPKRGTIYDRQLRPLALDIAAYSLYAAPRMMKPADIAKAIDVLPRTIDLDKDLLRERLKRDKGFVWLARKLSLDDMEKVLALKLRGIHFMKESKRSYPGHEAAAHLVGFAGTDGHGLEGLELKFDKLLAGREGAAQILRDARQQDLLIEQALLKPQDGFDLILTIDDNIQYFVEQALAKGFQRHRAMSASIVVLNPRTGEVLALANRPTYDLNEFSKSHEDQRKNRAVCDMYEPGSVFKVVLTSAALEKGIVQETDKVFCENGAYRIVNHTLHDHHAHGTLTFREVVEQSSNIGVVKIAQKLGGPVFNDYAQRFGFGKRTGIDVPGEINGSLKPYGQWSKISIGSVPIGHEVGVTTIQLACAIAAIANDGILMKPYVVKEIRDKHGETIEKFSPHVVRQVIDPATAQRVKSILAGAIERGTGKLARIKNVAAAGKTGTAQKIVSGRYSHDHFYATFIGFAPVEDPKVAMAIMFDNPRGTYFGGTVCAPIFKEIAENVLKYLQAEEAVQSKKSHAAEESSR